MRVLPGLIDHACDAIRRRSRVSGKGFLHPRAVPIEGDTAMAYLDLATPGHVVRTMPEPALSTRPIAARANDFDQREWTIIRLAREDRLSSLREESEFKQFLRLIFGFERTAPLSNPTLETLRRIAVLSWHHGYNIDPTEVSAFLTAGYSIDQYDVMLAHIGRERAVSVRRARR